MATSTVSLTNNMASDAAFQAFNTAIDTAILAMGWVHSADTGQMNPATATRAGVSTNAGYIIYEPADALQATVPIYLKIFFGQSATATMYRLQIHASTDTDGAGNLTGNTTTLQTIISTATTAAINCYFSGTTARLQFCLFPTLGTTAGFLSIERDKDATGVDTAYGFNLIVVGGNNLVWFAQYVPAITLGPTCVSEAKACTLISSQSSQAAGGSTGVGVVRPVSGALRNPGIGVLVVSRADWTTEVTNSVTIYSTARTYLAFTAATFLNSNAIPNNTTAGLFMLFE